MIEKQIENKNKETIDNLIRMTMLKLKNKNMIFHSESDFQFKFAWTLKNLKPSLEIILEYSLLNSRCFIDIVVIDDKIKYPIELKYFTKPHEKHPFLKKQNDTYRTYGVINDIKRVEDFVGKKSNDGIGYSIVLSNHSTYWNSNVRESSNYYKFRITNGRKIKSGETLDWLDPTAVSAGKNKPPLTLKGNYNFVWNDYVSDENNGLVFKYLINSYKYNED